MLIQAPLIMRRHLQAQRLHLPAHQIQGAAARGGHRGGRLRPEQALVQTSRRVLGRVGVVGAVVRDVLEGRALVRAAELAHADLQRAQARLAADLARDQVRALVVTNWSQLETARAQLISGQAAVTAAEIALNGIREEAKVGQRTTFDVLTAQQTLLNTRVVLVTAQRDRVVASYAVLAAMGYLSASRLNLTAQLYDPTVHLDQVKNKLIGTSTPDGR